jgi:hypothetical protein
MMRRSGTTSLLSFLMIWIGACQSGATTVENGNEGSSQPLPEDVRSERQNVQIAFVDFFDKRASLFVDGRELFTGVLTVARDQESTGLSRLLRVHVDEGRHVLRLVSDNLDVSVPLVITAQTKTIYVNAQVPPHIRAHDSETLLLD